MKKTAYYLLFLICMVGCKNPKATDPATAQLSDSLSLYFTKAADLSQSQEARIIFNQKALRFVLTQKQDTLYYKNLIKIADQFYYTDLEAYKTVALLMAQKANQIQDSAAIGQANNYLGDYYRKKSIADSAYLCYTKAERIYKQLEDTEHLGKIYLNKAFLFYDQGDYLRAQIAAFEALTYFVDNKSSNELYKIYNLIGLIFNESKEYEEAVAYYNRALNSLQNTTIKNKSLFTAILLNNLGLAYQDLNKDEQAAEYFQQALKEKRLYKDRPTLYAMLQDNLAYSQFKLTEYNELPGLFYKALAIRDSLQIIPGIVINKLHLSEYYQDQKDKDKAIQFATEAYTIAKEKGIDPKDILLALKQLKRLNSSKSTFYTAEYNTISDSLRRTEPILPDKMIYAVHEAKELALAKAALEARNKNRIIVFSSILFAIGVLFVLFYRKVKNKEAQLKLATAEQKANEETYELLLEQQAKIEVGRLAEQQRIALELHDGIINQLAATRLSIDVLSANKGIEESLFPYVKNIQKIEKEIRSISHNLNHTEFLKENNFATLVDALVEQQKRVSKTKYVLVIDPVIAWETLKNDTKMNLYRIIQEAIQNIVKYAKAKNVTLSILEDQDQIKIQIKDDGIGFDSKQKPKGIGLKNIKFRVQTIQGTLKIVSDSGKGTSIYIAIPYTAPVHRNNSSFITNTVSQL